MSRNAACALWLASAFVSVDTVVAAQETPSVQQMAAVDEIHAAGDWKTATDAAAINEQRWSADALRFEDNDFRGRIAVSGSPLIESANVEGRLSGQGMSGKLVDDEGNELARFEGTLTAAGASGTYHDSNGGSGQWHWERQLKQPLP